MGSGLYQDSNTQAQENRSSAFVLIIVGILGIVVLTLMLVGVIPLKFGNPYLFYGVMSSLFILFLVMGIVSLRNAKIFENKAKSEFSLADSLIKYVSESLSAENLDASILREMNENAESEITDLTEVSAEELFFKRSELIKEMLNHRFVNLNQDFLDHLIDEQIYDMIFVKGAE